MATAWKSLMERGVWKRWPSRQRAQRTYGTKEAEHTSAAIRTGAFLAALVLLGAGGCGGGGGGGSGSEVTPTATQAVPSAMLAATTLRTVEVPDDLAQAPFDSARQLMVPPGYGVRVLARVDNARFMALAPSGDILISSPNQGSITLLRPQPGGAQRIEFASGLRRPHDMAFHRIGDTTWLYVAETNRITRSVYSSGDTQRGAAQTVIDDLPDGNTPGLEGYAHELKNIAISESGKLYVAIASSCDACAEDTEADPVRGSIYQYNADGSAGRLFARGLRNAEGLDLLAGTDQLWAVVNSRDHIPYPFDGDITGDGASDFGQEITSFVDRNPPDLFTRVREGADYGWPFCHPLDSAFRPELAPDAVVNPRGSAHDCSTVTRADRGLPAHSAPLGMTLLHDSNVPAPLHNGALVAMHGCSSCSQANAGYRVVFIPVDAAGNAGAEVDLVSGFVTNVASRTLWGRPVDAIADASGNILISDDMADAVYQLYRLP